ncbi:MAG: DUF2079 domain-containing protein [Euryarchaeota archaeon]|nr:DUF2079 domain-containing protein [Euryarchaeota archaeon]MDE1836397.1 DUF2079 domain-containing protein [Euryarchaeota archaeon]MDE1881676.1 DUF2079 domain-containing protein [Euryarchaeota archaeon]MDE2044145.1 DUF2079 domain-containing protein [Thermoplasmata archaeon]
MVASPTSPSPERAKSLGENATEGSTAGQAVKGAPPVAPPWAVGGLVRERIRRATVILGGARTRLLGLLHHPRRTLRSALREPKTWLAIMVLGWTLLFGAIGDLRYQTFQTYAWDLGDYNQALFTTLFSHRFLYYTADVPAGTGGNLLAVHFSPFLVLLLPVYLLAPGPEILLWVQAAAVALAALPTFGIARRRLGSDQWGLLLAGVYLLWPVTQGLSWYDFHPESFLPLTVLLSLYFLEVGRPRAFLLTWVLAMSVIETIVPLLALCALLSVVSIYLGPRLLRAPAAGGVRHREAGRWWLAALVLSVLWLGLAAFAISSFAPSYGGAFGPNYAVNWSILGAPSALWVFPQAVLHPARAFAALAFAPAPKLLYIGLLFGPLLFLPWLGEDRYLLPALAWVWLAVLSDAPAYFQIGDQFPSYAAPFLIAGAIGGLVRLLRVVRARGEHPAPRTTPSVLAGTGRSKWRAHGRTATLPLTLVVAALAGAAVASPLLPMPTGSFDEITYGIPTLGPHDRALQQVLDLVPPHASIFTTSHLFPEVSSRLNAYVLPVASYFAGNSTFGAWVDRDTNLSQFVLVDYVVDPYVTVIFASYVNLSGFGIYASADQAYLYERGWSGAPVLFSPSPPLVVDLSSLPLGDATISPSPGGAPGSVAVHHAPGEENGTLLWGGLVFGGMGPGTYRLDLRTAVRAGGPEPGVALKVARTPLVASAFPINYSPRGHDYGFSETLDTSRTTDVGLLQVNGSTDPRSLVNTTETFRIPWEGPGLIVCQGWLLDDQIDFWLEAASLTQVAPSVS